MDKQPHKQVNFQNALSWGIENIGHPFRCIPNDTDSEIYLNIENSLNSDNLYTYFKFMRFNGWLCLFELNKFLQPHMIPRTITADLIESIWEIPESIDLTFINQLEAISLLISGKRISNNKLFNENLFIYYDIHSQSFHAGEEGRDKMAETEIKISLSPKEINEKHWFDFDEAKRLGHNVKKN